MFLSFSHSSTSSIDIHSRNPNFSRTLQMILRVAQYPSTVLIEGETGTGKEKIATLIHEASPRSMMPFVKINCGAIPDALAESELFGYEGGAFTGAKEEGQFRGDLYYRLQVAAFEKQIIERVLQETKSLRQAATILHIPHATLLRRIEKLGIQKNKDT